MGKTKTKIIDDSITEEPIKKVSAPKMKKKEEDSLVAKLNAELGLEGDVKSDEDSPLSEAGEVSSESTSSDVHEFDQAGDEQSESAELENQDQTNEPTNKEVKSTSKSKKVQKPGKATRPSSGRKPRSKKYQEVVKDLDRSVSYSLPEAIDIVKKLSYSKFDGSLEVHINTAQTGVRGLVSLPFAAGRKLRILAFGSTASKSDSDEVIFGDDSTITELEKGTVNFDILITTPEWMPKLAKVARILGPKGLMPNPKNGTITTDLKKAIENFQAGQTEYKTEAKAPVIHLGLGKLSQPTEELSQNVKTLLSTIGKSRIHKVTLSPTMGPSVKLDLSKVI